MLFQEKYFEKTKMGDTPQSDGTSQAVIYISVHPVKNNGFSLVFL